MNFEEKRRVQAPKRKRGKARGKRSAKDTIAADCRWAHFLSLKYRFLMAIVERHLDCKRRCQFRREQRLAIAMDRKGQKRKCLSSDVPVQGMIVVVACL